MLIQNDRNQVMKELLKLDSSPNKTGYTNVDMKLQTNTVQVSSQSDNNKIVLSE